MVVLPKELRRAIVRVSSRMEGEMIEFAYRIAEEAGAESVEMEHVEMAFRQVLKDPERLHRELQPSTRTSHAELRAG